MLLIGITQTEIIRHLESVGGQRKKAPHMRCLLFVGAGDGARTRYLHLGKVALYQMSYARIMRSFELRMVPPVGVEPTTRGFSVRCSTN